MESARPWLRPADRLALALLVIGCGAGLTALLLRPQVAPDPLPTPEEQQLRVRLLEQVPKSVELRYSDH